MTSDSPSHSRSGPGLLITVLLLLAVLGLQIWTAVQGRNAAAAQADRLTALENRVRQFGYEATTNFEGFGFQALLEHLAYWTPFLQTSSAGTTERFRVEQRVEDIVAAMGLLPNAYARIEAALLSDPAGGDSDEFRRWLITASIHADPKRSEDLLAKLLLGKEVEVGTRLRRFASSQLLQNNKTRSGEVLHRLLSVQPRNPRSKTPDDLKAIPDKQLFNYIDDYVASGHETVERTLLNILDRTEYYPEITVQRAVEALGKLKSKQAVTRFKKLFRQRAPVPGQIPNPIFRRKCMEALANTLGQEAVPFLREIEKTENDAGIQAKLKEYRELYDFGVK